MHTRPYPEQLSVNTQTYFLSGNRFRYLAKITKGSATSQIVASLKYLKKKGIPNEMSRDTAQS